MVSQQSGFWRSLRNLSCCLGKVFSFPGAGFLCLQLKVLLFGYKYSSQQLTSWERINGPSQSLMLCLPRITSSLPDGRSENAIWCGWPNHPEGSSSSSEPSPQRLSPSWGPRSCSRQPHTFLWILPPCFFHIPRNQLCIIGNVLLNIMLIIPSVPSYVIAAFLYRTVSFCCIFIMLGF